MNKGKRIKMITQDRAIVHLDLGTFYVSVERLMDSGLNGRPVK